MSNSYSVGDEGRASDLFKYDRALRRYLTQFASPTYGADDLLQDTYVAALTTIRNRGPPERMEPWLRRIGEWTAYRQRRREARHHRNRGYGDPNLVIDEREPDPQDLTIKGETIRALQHSLEGLPSAHRALVTGHYFSLRPLRDLAGDVGVGTDAVKVRLYRTRKRLKRDLED